MPFSTRALSKRVWSKMDYCCSSDWVSAILAKSYWVWLSINFRFLSVVECIFLYIVQRFYVTLAFCQACHKALTSKVAQENQTYPETKVSQATGVWEFLYNLIKIAHCIVCQVECVSVEGILSKKTN